jgi:hypothetical protein
MCARVVDVCGVLYVSERLNWHARSRESSQERALSISGPASNASQSRERGTGCVARPPPGRRPEQGCVGCYALAHCARTCPGLNACLVASRKHDQAGQHHVLACADTATHRHEDVSVSESARAPAVRARAWEMGAQ